MQPKNVKLRIKSIESATGFIKLFRFVSDDNSALPGFKPGAHIQIELPDGANITGGGNWRSYSLINFDPTFDTTAPAREYVIGIRREDEGRGGSLYIHHSFKLGDVINVRLPTDNFPLTPQPDILLIGGGIGITPIISMASELTRLKFRFDLHYSSRRNDQIAFKDELKSLFGGQLHLHADDDDTRLNITSLLKSYTSNQPIYLCGPKGMIDVFISTAENLGWSAADIHYELFTEATARDSDQPFEVELKSSGKSIIVPANSSLLETLEKNGVDMLYDCRSGYCGLCSVAVISGEIDHRDTYLSADDRTKGDVMQTCISRAKPGSRLVLDL